MRNVLNRIRRVEAVTAPYEEEQAAACAILPARRRLLGAREPTPFPPDWFAGCRSIPDQIHRAHAWNVRCAGARENALPFTEAQI